MWVFLETNNSFLFVFSFIYFFVNFGGNYHTISESFRFVTQLKVEYLEKGLVSIIAPGFFNYYYVDTSDVNY